ncbi:MAG TPA: hypothetical protein VND21_00065, partial [Planctomycetota bacterium]|nr:hypothetical protein [Planctomycetota bacterium]
MTRTGLVLSFATIFAIAPLARAGDEPKDPKPADAACEEAVSMVREQLALLKARIDEVRAARDAAHGP